MTPIVITEAQAEFAATNLPATYEERGRLPRVGSPASSIPQLHRVHPRERARGARLDHQRDVGEHQRHLDRVPGKSRSINPLMTGNGSSEWVKERSHLFRGITFATARRDQPYHFVRLGTFIERADNTARILNVVRRRSARQFEEKEVDKTDYYRLSGSAALGVGAEAYRDTYRDVIDAPPRSPRS